MFICNLFLIVISVIIVTRTSTFSLRITFYLYKNMIFNICIVFNILQLSFDIIKIVTIRLVNFFIADDDFTGNAIIPVRNGSRNETILMYV